MKKLLAIVVLGLLWSPSVFAEIDAEKIKTIKCELGSVEQSGEKLSEEMIKQFYKEGGLKTEIFRIKKNRVKSKTFKYFDNLWIKDNVITGSSTADKEHYGVTARVEKSISIDLNKMLALVKQQISLGQNGDFKDVDGPMTLNYLNCTTK